MKLYDAQALESMPKGQLIEQMLAMQEQLRLMATQRYGRRSEKQTDDPTADLFNEAEEIETLEQEAEASEPDTEEITYTRNKQSKAGRKPLPDHLPREVIEHDLPEADKVCDCGEAKQRIGGETSERLEFIPAKLYVEQHIRHQYACPCCEEHGVQTAEKPPVILPKSNAGPGLLAYTLTSKFQDSVPLARQSNILARHDIDIPRNTLARWHILAGEQMQPLIERFEAAIQSASTVLIDETRLQVNKEPDKSASSQSYMWVRRGLSPPDDTGRRRDVTLYHYSASRSGQVAHDLLAGCRGAVMTDGYPGYDKVVASLGLQHAQCLAHARRKFVEAEKALPKGKKSPAITAILNELRKLYAIEKRIKNSTAAEKETERQKQAVPVLDKLKVTLEKKQLQVPPKTKLGIAINYALSRWGGLMEYTRNGHLPIDNNGAENAIRPFVVGRKNWLFSDTVNGAKASATWYSIMETAKANGLEPYHYLKQVFEQLPLAKTDEDIDALLPWSITVTR
ncbi:MAG: IS66 family transposase [Natronospirillum sp.]|uniref:IS66 family transposase n=1 Tax=Natronospirillum sp. TaxID=2812955 RepID=UPI0025E42BC2|nr:IS66 family transposase [Natronospirillum sp.]MCH8553508.1 IS66 family transposase [Natronospirillum sp.]